MEIRLIGNKGILGDGPALVEKLKAWKAGLIDVLKTSPSKNRKFLRWNVVRIHQQPVGGCCIREVTETEESEVLPESSS